MINWLLKIFRKDRTFGSVRSGSWPRVRKDFLILHPKCEACGRKAKEIHHLTPVHIDSSKELLTENLLSICREHHFFVCHLNSWFSWNLDARQDCSYFYEKIKNRPRLKSYPQFS